MPGCRGPRALAEGTGPVRRTKLSTAEQIAPPLPRHLRRTDGVQQVAVAGSFRRRRETVSDQDIAAAAETKRSVMQLFTSYEEMAEVVEQGQTRATVRLRNGLLVGPGVAPEENFGAALCYLAGSKAHNIAPRQIAVDNATNSTNIAVQRRQTLGWLLRDGNLSC